MAAISEASSLSLLQLPPFSAKRPLTEEQFRQVVADVQQAIDCGFLPERIAKGSSGSYLCRNTRGDIVGVFKPRDEEPYGTRNPKLAKRLQKTCLPCCFGRAGLLPNTGFLSEAAASIVDHHLRLLVVPMTRVASLSSPSFSYPTSVRYQRPLPKKIGSFQLFMHGYMDASRFLAEGPQMLREGRLMRDDKGRLHSSLQTQFQHDFERLVILDYIIRNTDRGIDNWMVRYDEPTMRDESLSIRSTEGIKSKAVSAEILGSEFERETRDTIASTDAIKSIANFSVSTTTTASHLPMESMSAIRTIESTDAIKSIADFDKRNSGHSSSLGYDHLAIRPEQNNLASTDAVKSAADFAISDSKQQGGVTFSRTIVSAPVSTNVSTDLAFKSKAKSRASVNPPSIRIDNASISCIENITATTEESTFDVVVVTSPVLEIAAIDNGLAFPFKHPDEWRSYPYGWTSLPAARIPFSVETRQMLLPLLTSKNWWNNLVADLRDLFSMDDGFDERMFQRQIAVMMGQVYNIVRVISAFHSPAASLRHSSSSSPGDQSELIQNRNDIPLGSPLDLVQQPPCMVWDHQAILECLGPNSSNVSTIVEVPPISSSPSESIFPSESQERERRHRNRTRDKLEAFRGRVVMFVKSRPWFKSW